MQANRPKARKPTGRPSTYTEQAGLEICQEVADGTSLRQVCLNSKRPSRPTVYKWLSKYPAFAANYAQAREMLYQSWADEILEISDDSTTDMITKTGRNGSTYEAVDQEHIQRSRLRVDSRRWLLSKLLPKQFGDKLGVEVDTTVTHKLEISDRERMRRFALFMLEDQAADNVLTIEGAVEPTGSPISSEHQATPHLPADAVPKVHDEANDLE